MNEENLFWLSISLFFLNLTILLAILTPYFEKLCNKIQEKQQ